MTKPRRTLDPIIRAGKTIDEVSVAEVRALLRGQPAPRGGHFERRAEKRAQAAKKPDDHPRRTAATLARARKPAVWTYEPQLVQKLCDRPRCPHCVSCGCPLTRLIGDPKRFSCVRCIEGGKGIEPDSIDSVPMRTGEQD